MEFIAKIRRLQVTAVVAILPKFSACEGRVERKAKQPTSQLTNTALVGTPPLVVSSLGRMLSNTAHRGQASR